MIVFETERLSIRNLKLGDKVFFYELLSAPEIIIPIPQALFTEAEILQKFNQNLNLESVYQEERTICGIFEKENNEMIGLALFLINKEKEKELGYRFRKKYWGKGYGTETAKAMIDYYFKVLKVEKVTADVNVAYTGSVKILEKSMTLVKEFYNNEDQCWDRKYEIHRSDWLKLNGLNLQ
ncbi:hypothetical protein FFWV33_14515 [Flavobacterium faecale]|uniref:N-acetyltransferase domain-containing protein n=1 Tax=Flavobacterium faecale TaxID=1355330 RepID=A0A2S1LFW9_9FLAO|nr:GNAT family N-acetyltransferase [Flavobacterium faecale]AWG22654.1 hypothetical protein FFWV33_14515 [Flavobacterium faecale]